MLTKEAILAASDLKTETVSIPEWSGEVKVRSMTGLERDAFVASLRDADGKVTLANYRAKLLVRCMVNDDGSPMFTADELAVIGGKSSAAIDRVFSVAERLNAMTPDALDAAEKN